LPSQAMHQVVAGPIVSALPDGACSGNQAREMS